MSGLEDDVIACAKEWAAARRVCLQRRTVTASEYDRLAKAEAALQRAAEIYELSR